MSNQPFLRNYDINYPSLQSAFDAGDYCYVARHANDLETKGCALIMMGNFIDGLNILDKIDTEKALYYKAFGLWCEGEKKEALKILDFLERKGFEKAKKLKSLIKRKIKVLMQSPYPHIIEDTEDLEIKFISFKKDDPFFVKPYESIKKILKKLNWGPDFYFYFRPEYGVVPPDIKNLPFPTIAFTADYDIHLYQRYKQINSFNILIVMCSHDHYEVSHLFNKKVFTYVPVEGIFPVIPDNKSLKDIDIFISGNTFHPLFKHKVFLIDKIIDKFAKKYNILIINSSYYENFVPHFLPKQLYSEYLTRSKIILAPLARRIGIISTRALEALCQNCLVLCPKSTDLELFFTHKEDGVFFYSFNNLEEIIKDILENYNTYKFYSFKGKEKVEKQFVYPQCLQKFFKFLSFILKNLNIIETKKKEKKVCYVNPLTRIIHNIPVTPEEEISLHIKNQEIIKNCLKKRNHYFLYNYLAWAYIAEFYAKKIYFHEEDFELLKKGITILKKSKKIHPLPLINIFNLGRICYYAKDYKKAKKYFLSLLTQKKFLFNPLFDDIFPTVTFFPEDFCYEDYVNYLIYFLLFKEKKYFDILIKLIKMGTYFYLGKMEYESGNYKKAILYLKQSIKIYEHNPFSYLFCGLALVKYGKVKEGIEYLKKAVDSLPYLILRVGKYLISEEKYKKKWMKYIKTVAGVDLKKDDFLNLLGKEKLKDIELCLKEKRWNELVDLLQSNNLDNYIAFFYICLEIFHLLIKKEYLPSLIKEKALWHLILKRQIQTLGYKYIYFWRENNFDKIVCFYPTSDKSIKNKAFLYPVNFLSKYIVKNRIYPYIIKNLAGFIDLRAKEKISYYRKKIYAPDEFYKYVLNSSEKIDLIITSRWILKILKEIDYLKHRINCFYIDINHRIYKALWL